MGRVIDRLVIGGVVLLGAIATLVFAALLLGVDPYDLHDQCTTKLYSGIRVCDRTK